MSADSCTAPTVITRDNIHLSQPIQVDAARHTAVSNPVSLCTDPKVLEFIAAAKSASTLRAYDSDLAHFVSWGGCIPAQAEQVARYLADHATTLGMATLARRLVGIRSAHVTKGLQDPTHAELVRLTLRGIRRRYGRPQRRVAALSTEELFVIVRSLGNSTKDIRDAALLLVGFAGAFRRSEVSAIDCSNVEISDTGVRIVLPRSKTDQSGPGRTVFVRRVGGTICPVAALERWLSVARISNGPVFRRIARGGRVISIRISSAAVAHLLKARSPGHRT